MRVNKMPIKYKIDVLAELKNAGYSSYRLRQDKIFGERTIQKFRNKEIVSADNLATLCELLNCQPGDILEYEKE
jgi:DNA-binding Xre family transcriptional regulator